MKIKIIFAVILSLHLTGISFAQPQTVFKKHLFLGTWQMDSEDLVFEEWSYVNDELYTGKTYFTNYNDTTIIEILRLCFIDNIFCYCTTVEGQNDGKEIVFELKHIENYGEKFTFENQEHDFPRKIIYEFSFNNTMTVTLEGTVECKNKQVNYNFSKIPSDNDIAIFTGKLIKEQFVNKGGRTVEEVFDYFFEIEETPYFIRFKNGEVSLKEIEECTDNNVRLKVFLRWGLWDSDDETHQSRIGRYVNVLEIVPLNCIE
ncbi:MAG: hypothetical protein JW917_01665 [Ignavibacteria bacterium]|nr:hypothetical protein [Ignavibacteria bacterium]